MSERRKHLILVALILAALGGALLMALPASPLYKAPTLGLDLQGGYDVVLEAVPPEGRPLRPTDLDRSIDVMRERVDKLGVAEPEIRKQGENQISIQLPGVTNREQVQSVIGKTAQLEFFDLEADLLPPSLDPQGFANPTPDLYTLLSDSRVRKLAEKNGAGAYYLFDSEKKKLLKGPVEKREYLLPKLPGAASEDAGADSGEEAGEPKLPKGWKILASPEQTVVAVCNPTNTDACPGVPSRPTQYFFYLFKFEPEAEDPIPEMTGEHLRLNGTRADFDTQQGGQPIVLMQFTDEGAEQFQKITRREASRGSLQYSRFGQGGDHRPFNQSFAIVLDREIRSFPTIDFKEYPDGIPGTNGAQITGTGTLEETKQLALVLQTGALPVSFKTLTSTNISATLGEDSLRQAWIAALAGLALVAIFLLVFYRFLGLVAVIGLAIYAAFLYAALLVFGVTLTLPGFAGMILTIGVAADANIVIFERIKEESRAGKSVRAAIAAGYAKGFSTIIDANVVTAITALVLFAFATAGVKGFALMLLIGTAMSLITAVAATRAMLGLLSGFRWFNSPRFMGAQGEQTAKWLQIDFMGRRNYWFAMSGSVLAIAIGAIILQGLNLGIDFRGGTQTTFATDRPAAVSDVRDVAEKLGQANAQIQGKGVESDGKFREFVVRTEALDSEEQGDLTGALTRQFELGSDSEPSVRSVSASFGRQIAESALWAMLISFLLIVIYITIRFQWKFAVPVLVSIAHDVLITVGIYALTGREVTTSTVAAVLTVLGYSMYDTIIIFDRIRENIPLMRRASFASIANVSIWETIRRSLATTFITLLPVASLLFFGGETLKDFAFALLVGIGSGAYSTIFIASPLLTMWKEREPEYAKKRGAGTGGSAGVGGGGDGAVDDDELLLEATRAAADEPAPELVPALGPELPEDADKRERRRQRRRSRPHGRPR